MTPSLVDVIVPNWNGERHLEKCLGSLGSQTYPRVHPIVVDNGSTDGSVWDPGPLLAQYDAKRPARREMYLHLFGENEIDDMLDEMHARYEALIPDIPFIGESNFHLQWFIPNSEKLAEYLVVANYGVTKKEFSNLHLMQASKDLLAMGEEQLIAIGKMQFGYQAELFMAGTALWSQFRMYPDDYVIYFRRGDGLDFDWGLDYTQCANVQLYKKFDAVDLILPLICTQDYIAGSAMRTGRKVLFIGDTLGCKGWNHQRSTTERHLGYEPSFSIS